MNKKKKNYKISYDKMLSSWVVWGIASESLMIQRYASKNRKDCSNWLKKQKEGVNNE